MTREIIFYSTSRSRINEIWQFEFQEFRIKMITALTLVHRNFLDENSFSICSQSSSPDAIEDLWTVSLQRIVISS